MSGDEWVENEPNEDEADVCGACGAAVEQGAQGAFGFGTENVLCAACAAARGGRYDARRDAWDVAPDLTDLNDEAYGASPHERGRRRS
jgi:hypothetical protein